jgi:hypothetical protein
MIRYLVFIVFLILSLTVAGCGGNDDNLLDCDPGFYDDGSGVCVPVECPTELIDAGDAWFVNDVDFVGADSITFNLTFQLDTGIVNEFSAVAEETIQLWSTPTGIDNIPVTITTSPAGQTVNPGNQFIYQFTIDVSALPDTETGFGFRAVSNTQGTLGTNEISVISSSFVCL